MSLMMVTWLLGVFFIIIILAIVVFTMQHKALKTRIDLLNINIQTNDVLISQMQLSMTSFIESSTDIQSNNKEQHQKQEALANQFEHKIKILQQQIQQQQALVTQLQNQQPEDKLYSRAVKLVELGADVEEVMRECEMPRAEADMLMSIRRK